MTMKRSQWDTLIIGSGVGGLTAAANLVKAGLRVLVLERNLHPGGTAYVYQREGFSFPMGPLGFSNPSIVKEILRKCGGREELGFDRIHFHLRAFDLDLPLSLPFSEMVGTFTKHFPPMATLSVNSSGMSKTQRCRDNQPRMVTAPDDRRCLSKWRLRIIFGHPSKIGGFAESWEASARESLTVVLPFKQLCGG